MDSKTFNNTIFMQYTSIFILLKFTDFLVCDMKTYPSMYLLSFAKSFSFARVKNKISVA